jgi:hypothetical protein
VLRVVLAVLLAAALLAAATPAVQGARERATADRATSSLSRVSERATGLVASAEATPRGAARRHLRLALPDGGFAHAPLEYLAIGGVPDCETPEDTDAGDVVAYRLRGGDPRVAHVPVDLRVVTDGRVRDDDESLVLRGDASLTLALVDDDGPTVLVGRGSTPFETIREGGHDA